MKLNIECRASDRQCKAKRRANETEQETMSIELVTGSVWLKGEQMKLSKRKFSVELVTGGKAKRKGNETEQGTIDVCKEVMSLVILIKQILIIMPPCACTSPLYAKGMGRL